MELFKKIYKATEEGSKKAIWDIIQQFDPLINSQSKETFFDELDEDLKSEIQEKLVRRISNFKINKK